MIYEGKNFSYMQPVFANGDIIRNCNLTQLLPGTPICSGVNWLRFEGCNLINCKMPFTAIAVDCNNAQIDWCYWLHPDYPLPMEADNCRHVTNIDSLIVDGVTVSTFYTRQDLDA